LAVVSRAREQFVAILSETPSEIELDVAPGDEYVQIFAADLRDLFTDAGWTVGFGGTQFGIFDPTVYGIKVVLYLHIDSDEDQEAGARKRSVLQRAFDAAGLDVVIEVYRNASPGPSGPYKYMGFPETQIRLVVGHRPPPPK
jgi:hypothetical protein